MHQRGNWYNLKIRSRYPDPKDQFLKLAENDIRKLPSQNLIRYYSIQIDASTGMILPAVGNEMPDDLSRPELQLFDLRKDQLAAGIKLTESKRMPKTYGFATLGYGNPPGNNFFRDEFAPYYILGAGIKWNVFDWNKARNEKQVLSLQQDIIESRKTDMTDNLRRLLEIKKAEISSLRSLLGSDSELISVRKRISAAAESRYNNGTITATEYLNELNSEQEALISYEIHKINIAMAQVEYLNISGKEIE
jgi:outer membrane protein TolC